MAYSNYFSGIVRILEPPFQIIKKDQIVCTSFRAEIPQSRTKQFVLLEFWGNLARDILNYGHVNDYLLIEGYVSIRSKTNTSSTKKNPKQITITILKVYPLLLKSSSRLPTS